MGADLYLKSIFERNREHYIAQFEKAVAERDGLSVGTPEYNRAQAQAEACYEQIYAVDGYFRDPYNGWDVLWQLGLSWWGDVLPHVDDEGFLPVESVKQLLDLVNGRIDQFEVKMSEMPEEECKYFRERLSALRRFFKKAVALGEPICASL